ncbi:MAG TPA: amidohydrolase family protein [Cyclobacteriaceae bacterium]|nr:amidohydrolase family protein [Cyclobacteriaceae bacterium]
MIIDSHQHFWTYSPAKHTWINDNMNVLKRDFLPSKLWEIYQRNNIAACVAVQADASEQETDFLLQLAAEYDFIQGVVGWVDLQDKELDKRLEHYKSFDKLKGFRHLVQDEPDPDFMLREDFRKGLARLGAFDFTYDILIYPHQLDAAIKTVQDFPQVSFVLDHIAKPDIKNRRTDNWLSKIKLLAQLPHVYCKVSGMVTEADWQHWRSEDFIPYLDTVVAAFGIDRLMFGSDWPVCLLAGGYEEVLQVVVDYFKAFSEDDRDKLFRSNAARFYDLNVL